MKSSLLVILNIAVIPLMKSVEAFHLQQQLFQRRQVKHPNFRAFRTGPEVNDENGSVSRRSILSSGLWLVVVMGPWNSQGEKAHAFANKISSKYDDVPKRRGPQPTDLGVATRKNFEGDEYLGLKNCKPAPDCFCSTDSELDDPEHYIPAWIWPKEFGDDRQKAFLQLEQTILAYQPGEGNVDGGGFQIVTLDPNRGYLYAQFEALKGGYIDDVEFAYIESLGNHAVQVRSSSRVGYLDYGVNAKRLNYIAKALRTQGWNAPGVDLSSHPDYALQNGLT